MKTKLLYLDNSYLKEFEAIVEDVNNGKYIKLDKSAFYLDGGGQPCDNGVLLRLSDDEVFKVVFGGKFNGEASYEVDKTGLKKGDAVKGVIDWNRRYKLMRMHTAAHVVSSMFHDELGAMVTGNQKGVEKTRIDIDLEDFDKEKITELVKKASDAMKAEIDVKMFYMPRAEALNTPGFVKLANKLPPAIDPLRIVEIGALDTQCDGGTHVKNTKEVGTVVVLKMENKGKNNRRVYFGLED